MFFHSLQGNPVKIFFRLGMARNPRLKKRVKKEVRKACVEHRETRKALVETAALPVLKKSQPYLP